MINIASILRHVSKGLTDSDPRYQIIDSEHIYDTKTGIKFHLYADWIKATYNDEIVITQSDFTQEEQGITWEIKKLITDPAEMAHQQDNYQELLRARRAAFSARFETPEPLSSGYPVEEPGSEPYAG